MNRRISGDFSSATRIVAGPNELVCVFFDLRDCLTDSIDGFQVGQ
jgi:hypothetical protein